MFDKNFRRENVFAGGQVALLLGVSEDAESFSIFLFYYLNLIVSDTLPAAVVGILS